MRRCLLLVLCCSSSLVWADPPKPDLYVEDPYAPHNTSGSVASLGTMVGFLYGLPQAISELGITASGGQRWGRFSLQVEGAYYDLEAESTYTTALGPTSGNVGIGRGERLGVIGRLEVLRFDSHLIGPNSMAAVYVEGGAASEWVQFTSPLDNGLRPDNTHRIEGLVGVGLMLDHRLQEPIGFPHRIAWFVGLQLAMSPHEPMSATVCRSDSTCAREEMPEAADTGPVDQSMIFQSSLAFTF
ncbi:MAG TPA: hypothetical protein VGL61_17435 [Kofleriaceae bacterium]|jgi:hypothetical protein